MSLVTVATIIPKPECRDEVVSAITAAIPLVHANDTGCELYALHESRDRLVMIEKWTERNDLKAHMAGDVLLALAAILDGKLAAEIDMLVLRPHPAGTDIQGSI